MFANLLQLISRRAPPDYERGFVKEVQVKNPIPRNRRLERLILACWVLIALKSAVVVWAVRHYHVPFSPLWVIAPTVVFAILGTWVYWVRK
jgi:uncharacterized membrane protein YgcG